MKLIDILRKRASDDKFEKDICSQLSSKAKEIIDKASAHLEYVRNVLDEFDIHDVGHSEGVLKVMEDLLGDDAERLSSYDLFSLIAVAYLHDCGMAVSDAEINVMKLVENNEYDGKYLGTDEEAKRIIENNKGKIFKTERDAEEIKKWLFYPGSEQKLFDYYATFLREYHTFRNGKKDVIDQSKDHEQTNKELRLEYIRSTHADRAEAYIKTWVDTNFLEINNNKQAGKNLSKNIAKACKAHGADVNYIKGLEICAHYSGRETSNVQFVAMMLRIGDLAHFDDKRAPVVLRALHQFESGYSYEQWRIKADSGIEFLCEHGQIHCQGFCDRPKDYYDLTSYVDYIDQELELYNKLKYEKKWGEKYPSMTEKVDRNGLRWDEELFTPVPNLKFTLEQNRILDLLMGAELYSDEYACLRELYQNSLDACRCQIAKNNSEGKIEFGLKTDEKGEKYVYCLDNGKGMSKHIIENYLLKIGSSYYKSAEFYQSQAESGNTFTPTSQFGIGILSCFMIGDRVEITTREDGKDYISCVMENIHECFYYKATPQKDKDVISSSGTLIKIFLNNEYRKKMRNEYIEHIGYLLWKNEHGAKDKRNYLDHLYFILDGFVKVVPENITLNVQLSGGKLIKIENKPLPMGTGICAFPQNDDNKWNIERIEKTELKELDVEHEGIRYRSYLILPTEKNPADTPFYGNVLLGRNAYCVDGIIVDDSFAKGDFLKVTNYFKLGGVLNFIGAERPQLSISREKIVKYNPDNYEGKIKELLGKIVKQGIDNTAAYISEKNIKPYSEFYEGIWNSFFERFEDVPVDIVAQQLSGETIKDLVIPLPKAFTTSQMTYGDFWREKVCFEDYRMFESEKLMDCPTLLHGIIEYRVRHSASVTFEGNKAIVTGYLPNEESPKYLIPLNGGLFNDYDIVASLYPFASVSICRLPSDKVFFDSLYTFPNNFLMIIMGNKYGENRTFINLLTKDLLRIYRGFDKNKLFSYLAGFFNKNRNIILTGQFEQIDILRYYVNTNIIITFYIPISREQLKRSRIWEEVRYDNYRWFDTNVNISKDGGLSVVLFLNDDRFTLSDFYVIPGCWTRQELIDQIPDDVWNRLPHKKYRYTDGTKVVRRRRSPNP